jgi:hypothetical protein
MVDVGWLQALETATFLLSLVFFGSLKKYRLGAFVLVSFLAAVTDTIAGCISLFGWKSNYFLYNYYLLIYTPLLFLAFYPILNYTGRPKKLLVFAAIFSTILIVINYFFLQGRVEFNTYSEVLSTFAAVVLSMLLIVKLFTGDTTSGLINNPHFWVAAGTLIFSLGAMVVLGLQQFIAARNIKLMGVNIYKIIMPILNIFLYGGYSYAFILCKKLTSKQS